MTYEEFKALPWKWQGHIAMEHEHASTYSACRGRFGYCVHVPYRDGVPKKGRTYTHYMVDGKVYRSKEALVKAIEDIHGNIIELKRIWHRYEKQRSV